MHAGGSLYDALYGTDAIAEDGGAQRGGAYNPERGAKVIDFARNFLDESFPLAAGSHRDAVAYRVTPQGLAIELPQGTATFLENARSAGGIPRRGRRTVDDSAAS